MFLTKDDFADSITMMDTYENINSESDIKASIVEEFAKAVFEDFEIMMEDDKQEVRQMIFEDISLNLYNIN